METWHYTYVNPKTGKGWTDEEEKVIAGFTADGCGRMEAIRRLRRGQINGTITVPSDSTPAANSPVGTLMVKVLEKYPGMSFEDARAKANALIQESAGRRTFVMPKVLSESEQAEQKERLKTAWKPCIAADAAMTEITQVSEVSDVEVSDTSGKYLTRRADGTVRSFETEAEFDAYVAPYLELKAKPVAMEIAQEVSSAPVESSTLQNEFLGHFDEVITAEDKGIIAPELSQKVDSSAALEILDSVLIPKPKGRPRAQTRISEAARKALYRARNKEANDTDAEAALDAPPPRDYATPARAVRRKAQPKQVPDGFLAEAILRQFDKCIYCDRPFGSMVIRGEKLIRLTPDKEHFSPKAQRTNNSQENIFAACQICNRIKSSFLFDTIDAAKEFIAKELIRLGWKSAPPLIPLRANLQLFSLN